MQGNTWQSKWDQLNIPLQDYLDWVTGKKDVSAKVIVIWTRKLYFSDYGNNNWL